MANNDKKDFRYVQQQHSEKSHVNDFGIITEKPKYPQYAIYRRRFDTFMKWADYMPISKKDMVDAGLAYTGVGDTVVCYFCGGGFKNWEKGDVPMEEHAKWYPVCPHVLLTKGKEYVEKIGEGNKPETISKNFKAKDQLNLLDPWNSLAAKSCIEMNFSEKVIREAIDLYVSEYGHGNFKAVDLAEMCFQVKENHNFSEEPTCSANSDSASPTLKCSSSDEANNDEECIENLIAENNRLKEHQACKMCRDNVADIIFLPCGHMVSCSQCAPTMNACPMCRKIVNGQLKAFFAVKNDVCQNM